MLINVIDVAAGRARFDPGLSIKLGWISTSVSPLFAIASTELEESNWYIEIFTNSVSCMFFVLFIKY